MGPEEKELHGENNWSLFKLTCNKPCCDSGDAIYYCATCSEDPAAPTPAKVGLTPTSRSPAMWLVILTGSPVA